MRKSIALLILAAFLANTCVTPSYAQTVLDLPAPGTVVNLSQTFSPVMITGINVHPENAMMFDFIVDPGQSGLNKDMVGAQAVKLIKYFMAALAVPEDDLWVNLSPYEKDRIVPDGLGQTEMGRDMLAQDYLLKQVTASLIDPQDELGRKFWDRVYKEAYEKYGTSDVPVDAFNKVWIMPAKAVVYENKGKAVVVESSLKVMLEADYLAMDHNGVGAAPTPTSTSELTKNILREIVIPVLEKEVNTGKNFAQLRQLYNSLILAHWFRNNLKKSVLNKVYTDRSRLKGVDVDDKEIAQKIYARYVESFKKGVYNYVKEEYDPSTQETVPRKYFSGGETFNSAALDAAMTRTTDPSEADRFSEKTGARALIVTTSFKDISGQVTDAAEKQDGPAISMEDLRAAALTENSRIMALSPQEIEGFTAQYPGYNWQKAAEVVWPELVREKDQKIMDENQRNYFRNQPYVRRDLLFIIRDLLAHQLSDEQYIERMIAMHVDALTVAGIYDPKAGKMYLSVNEDMVREMAGALMFGADNGNRKLKALKELTNGFLEKNTAGRAKNDVIADMGRFYAASFEKDALHVFTWTNHAWLMQMVNMMLRMHDLNGIEHGYLDQDYQRVLRDEAPVFLAGVEEKTIAVIREANPVVDQDAAKIRGIYFNIARSYPNESKEDKYSILNGLSQFNSREVPEEARSLLHALVLTVMPGKVVRILDLGAGSGRPLSELYDIMQAYKKAGTVNDYALGAVSLSHIPDNVLLKKGYAAINEDMIRYLQENPGAQLAGLKEYISNKMDWISPSAKRSLGIDGKTLQQMTLQQIGIILRERLQVVPIPLRLLLDLQAKGYGIFKVLEKPFIQEQHVGPFLNADGEFLPGVKYDLLYENRGAVHYSLSKDPQRALSRVGALLSDDGIFFSGSLLKSRSFDLARVWSQGWVGIRSQGRVIIMKENGLPHRKLKVLLSSSRLISPNVYEVEEFRKIVDALSDAAERTVDLNDFVIAGESILSNAGQSRIYFSKPKEGHGTDAGLVLKDFNPRMVIYGTNRDMDVTDEHVAAMAGVIKQVHDMFVTRANPQDVRLEVPELVRIKGGRLALLSRRIIGQEPSLEDASRRREFIQQVDNFTDGLEDDKYGSANFLKEATGDLYNIDPINMYTLVQRMGIIKIKQTLNKVRGIRHEFSLLEAPPSISMKDVDDLKEALVVNPSLAKEAADALKGISILETDDERVRREASAALKELEPVAAAERTADASEKMTPQEQALMKALDGREYSWEVFINGKTAEVKVKIEYDADFERFYVMPLNAEAFLTPEQLEVFNKAPSDYALPRAGSLGQLQMLPVMAKGKLSLYVVQIQPSFGARLVGARVLKGTEERSFFRDWPRHTLKEVIRAAKAKGADVFVTTPSQIRKMYAGVSSSDANYYYGKPLSGITRAQENVVMTFKGYRGLKELQRDVWRVPAADHKERVSEQFSDRSQLALSENQTLRDKINAMISLGMMSFRDRSGWFMPYADLGDDALRAVIHEAFTNKIGQNVQGNFSLSYEQKTALRQGAGILARNDVQAVTVTVYGGGSTLGRVSSVDPDQEDRQTEFVGALEAIREAYDHEGKQTDITLVVYDSDKSLLSSYPSQFDRIIKSFKKKHSHWQGRSIGYRVHYGNIFQVNKEGGKSWEAMATPSNFTFMRHTWVGDPMSSRTADMKLSYRDIDAWAKLLRSRIGQGALIFSESIDGKSFYRIEKPIGSDAAEQAVDGGIDLKAKNMNVEIRGQGIDFQLPEDMRGIDLNNIEGLTPVIINVTPVQSMSAYLFASS